jgi:hypothetical protein
MDCADGGHILVSKTVADVLLQLSNWKTMLHDLNSAIPKRRRSSRAQLIEQSPRPESQQPPSGSYNPTR